MATSSIFAYGYENQDTVGGGVIFLECEDNEKLLSFYQNEHNNYQVYGR